MNKTINIPEGNEFSLFVPFVVFSGAGQSAADAALWNNITTKVYRSNTTTEIEHTTHLQEQYVVLSFADNLALGSYDVIISGEYETRKVCAPLNNLFARTRWADGNYADFIVGQPIICPQQPIIGQFNTTQDIEDLTEELRAALAAAEAAKAEYEEKVEELSDVAQQSTLTQGISDIRADISHIDIDTTTIAKQGTNASATLTATQTAATNAYASAEAAKTATIDGNDTAIGVAKEIRSEVGTGSDTAAETGTLFAVVKWVKDKIKAVQGTNANATLTDTQSAATNVETLVGTPASGQPATLFAAIAAGGGGGGGDAQESTSQAILAEIGSAGSGQSPTLFGAIGDVALSATTLQSLADSWAAMVTNRQNFDGWTFVDYTPTCVGDIICRKDLLYSINDTKVTTLSGVRNFANCNNLISVTMSAVTLISANECFYNMAALVSASFPNVRKITGYNIFASSSVLTSIDMPLLERVEGSGREIIYQCTGLRTLTLPSLTYMLGNSNFQACSNLRDINLPEITQIQGSSNCQNCSQLRKFYSPKLTTANNGVGFGNCTRLIDFEVGAINSNANFNTWNPTEALSSSSTSLVEEGETFSSNLEKLLYNVREHIAAKITDRTGLSALTMTLHANMKTAINADTATAQAFTNKNWTIA